MPKRQRTDEAHTVQQVAGTGFIMQTSTDKRQKGWTQPVLPKKCMTWAPGGNDSTVRKLRVIDDRRGSIHAEGRPRSMQTTDNKTYSQSSDDPPRPSMNARLCQASSISPKIVDHKASTAGQAFTPLTTAIMQSRLVFAGEPCLAVSLQVPCDEYANRAVRKSTIPSCPDTRVLVRKPKGRLQRHWRTGGVPNMQGCNASLHPAAAASTLPQLSSSTDASTLNSNLTSANLRANGLSHQDLDDVGRMRKQLNDFFSCQGPTLNPVDDGRKLLTQEALQKEDWFCILLCQAYCLKDYRHSLLPKQLQKVPPDSWSVLEQFLCSNRALTPSVLSWFAQFPRTMQMKRVSGECSNLSTQLDKIAIFLTGLPRRWEKLIDTTNKRKAPPLAHDLADQLYLVSPVLQTSVYRKIARQLWGEDSETLQFLEYVLQKDQHMYFHQDWQTTRPGELQAAIDACANEYDAWRLHKTTSSELFKSRFVPPTAWSHFFQQRPAIVTQAPGASTAHRQYDCRAAPQIPLMDLNRHAPAQQRRCLTHLVLAEQHDLPSNNHTTLSSSHRFRPTLPSISSLDLASSEITPHAATSSLQSAPNRIRQPPSIYQHCTPTLPITSSFDPISCQARRTRQLPLLHQHFGPT